ncbi:hypothetical protein HDV00_005631 [Rhizophlyctis rosea]|nr:hypothetical protein HDV00_005631 [Rhizophlyctis rosea]
MSQTITPQDDWLGRKADNLRALQEKQNSSSVIIGEAHTQAQEEAIATAASIKNLRVEIGLAQQREILREGIASEKFEEEKQSRLQPLLTAHLLRTQIKHTENARASQIAHLHRQTLSTTAPTIEIPPNPHHRLNRSSYEHTSYNRSHVAIRCTDETTRSRPNALHSAVAAAAERENALRVKEAAEERLKRVAEGRGREAMQQIFMDQEKHALIKDLQHVVEQDRKRRIANAMHHARSRAYSYIDVNEDTLRERFAREFRIGMCLFEIMKTFADRTGAGGRGVVAVGGQEEGEVIRFRRIVSYW